VWRIQCVSPWRGVAEFLPPPVSSNPPLPAPTWLWIGEKQVDRHETFCQQETESHEESSSWETQVRAPTRYHLCHVRGGSRRRPTPPPPGSSRAVSWVARATSVSEAPRGAAKLKHSRTRTPPHSCIHCIAQVHLGRRRSQPSGYYCYQRRRWLFGEMRLSRHLVHHVPQEMAECSPITA
jgi:hypothetical protein